MIREATESDIPQLVEMARAMHAESPRYQNKQFDEGVTAQFINILISGSDFCVFVSGIASDLTGMIGCSVSPFFFSFVDKYACDVGFYVKPEHRGGGSALKLIKAYEDWALEKGVLPEDITLGVSCENKKLGELMTKMGYTQSGELYRKNGKV